MTEPSRRPTYRDFLLVTSHTPTQGIKGSSCNILTDWETKTPPLLILPTRPPPKLFPAWHKLGHLVGTNVTSLLDNLQWSPTAKWVSSQPTSLAIRALHGLAFQSHLLHSWTKTPLGTTGPSIFQASPVLSPLGALMPAVLLCSACPLKPHHLPAAGPSLSSLI